MSSDGAVCPYCGHEHHVECEDYSEDSRAEECSECGMKFYQYESFTVDHHTRADCELNGGSHEYEQRSIGHGKTHGFCIHCDKVEPISFD